MKYYEVEFTIEAPEELMQTARDIVAAQAGEAGFESFEETETGLKGYVTMPVFDSKRLIYSLQMGHLPGVNTSFTVREAAYKNWNEQWEQEGFEPIEAGGCVIHDGRHGDGAAIRQAAVSVEIDAHLAFGTGNHETTRMMVATLMAMPLEGRRVLDCGCGTGILAIVALKRGAREAVGYDIDEWSADNARHNAVINGVDDRFRAMLGDASILKEVEGTFDVVLANINRNILLADMPAFCSKLGPEGRLLLSGFYDADVPMLTGKAQSLGLTLESERREGEWACIVFRNTPATT